jgi:hypothetical protein
MQDQRKFSPSDVAVTLDISSPAVVGLSVLAMLSVTNRGGSPVTVSSRLNLMEGDVKLLVTRPDGGTGNVTGAGGQPDTSLRQATLAPGQQIVGVINLLYTSVGATLPAPGNYTLRAEYYPSSRMQPVCSEPAGLAARLPQTSSERGAAAILEDEKVKRALVLAESDAAPESLQELATRFGDTLDGKLAQLILAANPEASAGSSDESIFLQADPLTIAQWITALSTPFSSVGKRLAKRFATIVENRDVALKMPGMPDPATMEKALRIIKGQPIETRS